jgi:hypothetical protein
MRITSFITNASIILTLSLFSPVVSADDPASARAIAGILAELNQVPSDEAKSQLAAIENDVTTSPDYKIIARAIHNLNHTVDSSSRDVLNNIAVNNAADSTARELAEILVNFQSTADEVTRARLQELR